MYTQCTDLTPKASFTFKNSGKGRDIIFKQGQKFWVTNTIEAQKNTGLVNVGRMSHHAGTGYNFTLAMVAEFFIVIPR